MDSDVIMEDVVFVVALVEGGSMSSRKKSEQI